MRELSEIQITISVNKELKNDCVGVTVQLSGPVSLSWLRPSPLVLQVLWQRLPWSLWCLSSNTALLFLLFYLHWVCKLPLIISHLIWCVSFNTFTALAAKKKKNAGCSKKKKRKKILIFLIHVTVWESDIHWKADGKKGKRYGKYQWELSK